MHPTEYYLVWNTHLADYSADQVGQKAARLVPLIQKRFEVPEGFTITTAALDWFIEENGIDTTELTKILKNKSLSKKDLEKKARKVQENIEKGEWPEELNAMLFEAYTKITRESKLAVRSSSPSEDLGTYSFAGQYTTTLNVESYQDFKTAIKETWKSCFDPRVLFYRQSLSASKKPVTIAVLIQQMVESEVAGTTFTAHPVRQDNGTMIIEAISGLGEDLVQGTTTPDYYEIQKQPLKILTRQLTTRKTTESVEAILAPQQKPLLSDYLITQLATLSIKVEQLYGFQCDIEWAYSKGKFILLQVRPVTSLNNTVKENKSQVLSTGSVPVPVASGVVVFPGFVQGKIYQLNPNSSKITIPKGAIVITQYVPTYLAQELRNASAVLIEQGGLTSHAAIICRELEIPALTQLKGTLKQLSNNQLVTVDAQTGLVFKGVVVLDELKPNKALVDAISDKKIELHVSIDNPMFSNQASKLPVAGIGLLKAEYILSEEIGFHPQVLLSKNKQQFFVTKLVERLAEIANAFYPRPVIYRTSDLTSDEYARLKGGYKYEVQERNPFLGERGVERYTNRPQAFLLELEAIKTVRQEYNLNNLHVSTPYVRTVEEVKQIKQFLSTAQLTRRGSFKYLPIIEVPNSASELESILNLGVDGIVVDTDDLVALMLGVEPNHSIVKQSYSRLNSGVFELIGEILKVCKKHDCEIYFNLDALSINSGIMSLLIEKRATGIIVDPAIASKLL